MAYVLQEIFIFARQERCMFMYTNIYRRYNFALHKNDKVHLYNKCSFCKTGMMFIFFPEDFWSFKGRSRSETNMAKKKCCLYRSAGLYKAVGIRGSFDMVWLKSVGTTTL